LIWKNSIMQAVEFSVSGVKDSIIQIPDEYARLLKGRKKIKIIILFAEEEEEGDWDRLALQQFFEGYSEEDSIYDKL